MNDKDRLLAAMAADQHQVFSRPQCKEVGMTPSSLHRRLRSGIYRADGHQALRFAGTTLSWRGELQAGLFNLGEGALVGGRAAAALHRLDGFDEGPLAYLVERPHRGRDARGRVRSTSAPLAPHDRVWVSGLAVVHPTRLILELATELKERELGNALDSALRLGLTTVERMLIRERDLFPRGGPTVLDRVLDSAGVQSWLERRFLDIVRQAGLPRPAIQRVYRRNGQHVARVDFDWHPFPVIVEVGGRRGYLSVEERNRQERRRNALQAEGKTVYFLGYDDVVHDTRYVLATVTTALGLAAA